MEIINKRKNRKVRKDRCRAASDKRTLFQIKKKNGTRVISFLAVFCDSLSNVSQKGNN
jgi:hypothetical protein